MIRYHHIIRWHWSDFIVGIGPWIVGSLVISLYVAKMPNPEVLSVRSRVSPPSMLQEFQKREVYLVLGSP